MKRPDTDPNTVTYLITYCELTSEVPHQGSCTLVHMLSLVCQKLEENRVYKVLSQMFGIIIYRPDERIEPESGNQSSHNDFSL